MRDQPNRQSGFMLAPLLYMLALGGIGAAVMFSGYSQVLRSNSEMNAVNTVRQQLNSAGQTLSASSVLDSATSTIVQPPQVATFGVVTDTTRLPGNYATVNTTGTPHDYGVIDVNTGVRQLDPWGKYYIYCRWENAVSTSSAPSIMVISGGPDGVLSTKCGDTAAQGDDRMNKLTVAEAINRANVWQVNSSSQVKFGIAAQAVKVNDDGSMTAKSLTLSNPLAITSGGTGAIDAAGARTNLSVPSNTGSGASGLWGIDISGNAATATVATALQTARNFSIAGSTGLTAAAISFNGTADVALNLAGTLAIANGGTNATTAAGARTSLAVLGIANNLSDVANAATARTNLAVLGIANNLSDVANVVTARTNLGLGTMAVQDANNVAITGGTITGVTITGNVNGNVTGSAGSVPASGITGIVGLSQGGTGVNASNNTNLRNLLGIDNASNLLSGTLNSSLLPVVTPTSAGTYNWGTVDIYGRVTAASNTSANSITQGNTGVSATDTGTDGTVTISTEGVARVTVDPNGNVGIGTITPADKLDVNGNIRVRGAAATDRSFIYSTLGSKRWALTENNVAEGGSNTGSNFVITRYDDTGTAIGNALAIARNTGAISTSGDLAVGGAVTATGGFFGSFTGTFNGSFTGTVGAAGSNGQVQFNNAGNLGADTAFNWDNTNKRLGIGTATPANLLTTYGADNTGVRVTNSNNIDWLDMSVNGTTATSNITASRDMYIKPGYRLMLQPQGGAWGVGLQILPQNNFNSAVSNQVMTQNLGTFSPSSGSARFTGLEVSPTISQTGTASGDYTALLVNSTEISATGIKKLLLDLQTNTASKMVVTSAGNVGIGTATPSSMLHVDNGYITSSRYGQGGAIVLRGANGTQSTPTALAQNANAGFVLFRGYDGGNYKDMASITAYASDASGITSSSSAGYLTFSTTSTGTTSAAERMRIDATGNVGIGSPPPSGDKLYVFNSNSDVNSNSINAANNFTTTTNGTTFNKAIYASINPDIAAGKTNSGRADGLFIDNISGSTNTGTLAGLTGAYMRYGLQTGAGMTVNNAYGLLLEPFYQSGTIGNMYDFYIASGATGGTLTNHYSIYNASSAKSFFAGTVGIGNSNPAASAALDVYSTTQGFLMPRVTTVQRDAIASPATGLMVYNTTTNLVNIYNGSAWTVAGNDGTTAFSFPAGTVTAPGLYVTGDSNTGFYQSAADKLSVTAGGTEVMRWNTVTSAVNYLNTSPAVAGAGPIIAVDGADANIDLNLNAKGTGTVRVTAQNAGAVGLTVKSAASPTADMLELVNSTNVVQSLFDKNGSLGIGTTTVAATAVLDLVSTSKGILLPRMTTAQRNAIATPATGLTVYNTSTNTTDYYNGTAWVGLLNSNFAETDPKVGSLTPNNFCTANAGGSQIVCTTAAIAVTSISATGTPSSATFLRGDGQWVNTSTIGGLPGGANTNIQFNNSGAFAGDANFVWDNTNKRMGIGSATPTESIDTTGNIKTIKVRVTAQTGFAAPAAVSSATIGTITPNAYCTANAAGTQVVCTTAAIPVTGISATGTASSTTYLRGDGTWATPASASGVAGSVQFSSGGNLNSDATNFFWDNTNKRLGIGTATPANALTVIGTIGANSSTGNVALAAATSFAGAVAQLVLTNNGTGGTNWSLNSGNSTTGTLGANFGIAEASNYRMVIAQGGNVGIGTTVPNSPLEVVGDIRSSAYGSNPSTGFRIVQPALDYRMYNNAGIFAVGSWTAAPFALYTSGIERLRVDTSGNVGIGTTAPPSKLSVYGDATAYWPNAALYLGDTSTNGRVYSVGSRNGVGFHIGDETAGISRFVISSSGNVGIGSVSPGQKLSVAGVIESTTGGFKFPDGTTQTTASAGGSYALVGGSNATGTWPISVTGTAQNANQLIGKNWYWSGQGGQPTWLWGGSDGTNMYVYNPSNFVVSNVTALSGTWDGINYFRSNKGAGSYVGSNSSYALEAFSTDGGAAGMSFHRGGYYAVNMGLDPDNVLRIGGWSAGANLWQLNMSGTQWLAGGLYTGGGGYFATDGNIYMPWLGDWMSNRMNQDVRSGSSPTFNDPYVNNWVRINGGGGMYWQAYGGGFYMQDSTWIRTYNGKYFYESAGFDTGGASGVGCGGGLGGGFTFRVCGSSQTTGDAYASNFYHNSDRRLKDNIKPIAGLDKVIQMQGVTFNWKKDGVLSAGVIAQDIEKIMPEAVQTKPDGFKAVSYDSLIAPMIEAIKELKTMLDRLADKVAQIFTRVDAHDADIKALREELKQLHTEFTNYKAAHP